MRKFSLMPFFLLMLINSLYAQNSIIEITCNYADTKFRLVAEDMESRYPIKFFYSSDCDSIPVNASLNNASLELFLQTVHLNTGLNFFLHGDRNIITTRKFEIKNKLSENFFENKPGIVDTLANIYNILDQLREISGDDENNSIENRIFEIGDISQRYRQDEGTIAGYLREATTGEPIIGASITIREPVIGVITDQFGYYSFTLPKGRHELFFNSIGMKKTKRQVMLYSDGNLDVDMIEDIVALKEVVISGERENVDNIQTGLARLNIQSIKQIPTILGEADIMKIALTLPGVQSVGEGATGFNVRGGATDQNLILLNDVPIYNTNHLFGFFSAFNADVISEANLYKSGIQANYGGRLSSVFDVALRDGNKKNFSVKGGISPVTGRVTVEGPIKKDTSSFIVGLRSTYSDWILGLMDNPDLRNSTGSFSDVIAKVTHQVDSKNSVVFSGYHSRDRFKLNSDTLYRYFNSNMAVQWRHSFNNKIYNVTSASFANYHYELTSDLNPAIAFDLNYRINQTSAKTDFNYFPNTRNSIRFGLSTSWYSLKPGSKHPLGAESLIEAVDLQKENGVETALYFGNEYEVNPLLSVYGGLRMSFYNAVGPGKKFTFQDGFPKEVDFISDTITYKGGKLLKTYGGPELRLSARYKLSQDVSVKLSYDRMRQYVHMLSNSTSISPTDTWRLSDQSIKPQIGDQIATGIYKTIFGTGVEISLEGYYKRLQNILEYKDGADLLLNEVLETDVIRARGKSYGVEFLLKKNTGKFNGWLSYTYSRALVKANGAFASERINSGNYFPSSFDKPHNLVVITNYKFNRRINASLNLSYSTGRPITYPLTKYKFNDQPYVFYTDRNKFRISNYFRMDFGINFEGNHKVKKLAHGSWSFSIYNLTGRDNAYSVFFRSEEGQIKGYKLSIFANPIPTLTYNFHFR
ncbi:MAG: TonB-dependent receptor [Bacteroidetes bacterium]|nr:TonB-dependent receptor [Bacteroidota bacterium]MDA1120598.1 TonB-dependent receptor [Bacteroidota bacterium]